MVNKRADRPKSAGATRSAWPLLMAASVAVLAVFLLSWWNQARIEDRMRTDTGNALSTVLQATTGSVEQWLREREQEARVWAGHIQVRDYAKALAEEDTGVETAERAAARVGLQIQLDAFALGMGYQGYLVLSRAGAVLASHDPATARPGARDVVREEFLSDVMSAPRYGAVELPHLLSRESGTSPEPTMLIGAAIREDDGGVMAALVLLVDPQRAFTQILQRGRIGESGESYAFDRSGQLISESRFDDQLRGMGLISEAGRAILNIQIRDPGGNLTEGFQPTIPRSEQPLTLMAEQAITNGPGANLDGYNDYRGVPVVGAWTWNETDGIGIATEMDVAEAYQSVRQLRRSALYTSLVLVFLVLSLTGLFLRNRFRMTEAHSELGSVVQRFRSVTESANDAIISSDSTSTVVGWNRAAADMFGWSDEEIIGQPLETIIPERFRESHKAGMNRFTATGEKRIIGETVELSGLHREGHEFPIELSLSTWKIGGNHFYSGIIRDITERKRMEKELEKARQRMEKELNVGREIQMSMLPLIFPPYPRRSEFDVYAKLEPAREVGGDFYDFFLIDEELFGFCVGDVSGKGVPAALFMAVTKTLIEARARTDRSPASVLTHVNDEISRNNDASMFVTIFLALLDTRTGSLRYASAGHNPPFIRRNDGELVRLGRRHGPVVGAMEGVVYGEDQTVLAPRDRILLYTDGVTESMNGKRELYGEQRLEALISESDFDSVKTLVDATVADVWLFEGGVEQTDDVTVLGVEFFGADDRAAHDILELRLSVLNRLEEIRRVIEEFDGFAERNSIPAAPRRAINVTLDELLNNTISYAFEDDADHLISVRVELSGDRLCVTIRDDGVPFNPFTVAAPDSNLTLEERPIGGLGIHLVQHVMDEVSYHRGTRENVVSLVKYFETQDLS